jgi:hypothetical protein
VIEYVDARLGRWARWSWERADGQHFRVSQYDYQEHLPRSYVSDGIIPMYKECVETEQAVAWLRIPNRRASDTVIVVYRDHPGWSKEMQARILGICRQSLYRSLDSASVAFGLLQ